MNTAMLSLSTRSEFQNYRNMYCVSVCVGGGGGGVRVCMYKDKYTGKWYL